MDQPQVQQLFQQALSEQERRFTATINDLQARVQALELIFQHQPNSATKAKLPHPDKFDGTSTMWEVWNPEINAKLRIDSKALGDTDEAKFWYVYGRLEKKVQALVAPQLKKAESTQSYHPQDLFNQLARLCDNPNAIREAQDKLYSLKQYPDQSFNVYLAVFERQLYKAEADEWDDQAKISLVRRQLNDKLKKRLRTQITLPSTYPDFVKVLQQLDDSNPLHQASPSSSRPPPRTTDAMQIGTVAVQQKEEELSTDDEDKHVIFNYKTGEYREV